MRIRVVLLAALLTLAIPAGAQALTVYAASSLRGAMPSIAPAQYSFAGSNELQLQIERGAPADVFASASPREAMALFHAGRCSRPVTFATNALGLLVPRDERDGVRSVASLRSGGWRVAVGAPGVPIGDYTREVLRRMRLASVLTVNTVSRETDVAGITGKVALGSADAGFAYLTDGRLLAERVTTLALPWWAQPPVQYRACAVQRPGADHAGARAYIARLVGPHGRAALRDAGFGLPPRG